MEEITAKEVRSVVEKITSLEMISDEKDQDT